jgi:hypothetical protein
MSAKRFGVPEKVQRTAKRSPSPKASTTSSCDSEMAPAVMSTQAAMTSVPWNVASKARSS